MAEQDLTDQILKICNIATPILILLLSGVGWKIKTSITRKSDLENKLREDRIATYNIILEPFIIILISDAHWKRIYPKSGKLDKNTVAEGKIFSMEFRNACFKMSLVANDETVDAFNKLIGHLRNDGGDTNKTL